jgi:hypothetical protein
MKFACTITRRSNGQWSIRHEGSDTGLVEVTAASREEAAQKMQDEIRYRLELCPCTGERYKNVQIELVEAS